MFDMKPLPAATVEIMNTALEGSGFHVSEEGVICKGPKFTGMRVAAPRGRVQVRHVVSDRLYWSGPAADIRAFTRAFWFSA